MGQATGSGILPKAMFAVFKLANGLRRVRGRFR
jgi:hypothetical protein